MSLLELLIEDKIDEGFDGDWLQFAPGQPSGKIAQFALHAFRSAWIERGRPSDWTAPESLVRLYDKLLDGFPASRTVIGSSLHFLVAANQTWAEEKLLPLFSMQGESEAWMQVWSGFLGGGRPSALVLPHLLPHLREALRGIARFNEPQRRRLPSFIAWFAFLDEGNPLPWLREFLSSSLPDDRARFAQQISSILRGLEPSQREELWEKWLESYFLERMVSAPRVEDEEKIAFVGWCEEFREKLPAIARSLVELSPPMLELYHLHQLLATEEDRAMPISDDFGQLLLWTLNGQDRNRFHPYYASEVRNLLEKMRGRVGRDLFRRLVVRYSELGGTEASDLMEDSSESEENRESCNAGDSQIP